MVLSFLDAMKLDDAVLVGSDTGGAIVQAVAAASPERVRALTLTNCDAFDTFPPFPFNLQLHAFRHEPLGRLLMLPMRSATLRNSRLGFGSLTSRRLGPSESAAWIAPYRNSGAVRRDLAAYARSWDAASLKPISLQMRSVLAPTSLCWGTDDKLFPVSLGRRLADTFPNGSLRLVHGAGALVSLDAPEAVADSITACAS